MPQASFDFCETVAQSYGGVPQPSTSGGVSSAEASGADPPPAAAFVRIEPQPESFTFTQVPTDVQGKTFEVEINWLPAFHPSAACRFDTVPGRVDGLTFQLPDAVATAVRVQTLVDASAVPGSSFTVHSLLMQGAAPPVDPPVRQPVPSHILPPKDVSETEARLSALGWRLAAAKPNGDCAPLSISAGHEITPAQAANPSPATTEAIRVLRNEAVQLVAGTDAIAGIPASVFREAEGLPKATGAAQRACTAWRKSFHWRGKGNASAAFLFGCAVRRQRNVAVLALNEEGAYVNPARVYGLRDGAELRRTPANGGSPETIPSWTGVPIDTLLESLRSHADAYSLLKYNGSNHFDPFLFDSCTAAPGEVATEVVAGDLGAMSDVEDAPAAAASMPPGWVAPGQVSATFADSAQEAERQSVRMSHVETGFSGFVQPPAIAEGTLAGNMAQSLATGHVELPGEGPAIAEVSSLSRAPAQELASELPGQVVGDGDETQAPDDLGPEDIEDAEVADGHGAVCTEESPVLDCGFGGGGMDDNAEFEVAEMGSEAEMAAEAAIVAVASSQTQLRPAESTPPSSQVEVPQAPLRPTTFAQSSSGVQSALMPPHVAAPIVHLPPAAVANAVPVSAVPVAAVPSAATPVGTAPVAAVPIAAVPVATVAVAPAARKRKQRAAAVRANAAFAAEESLDESPPPKVPNKAAAVAPDVREASLQEALSGAFRRFEVVRSPPDWLGDALKADSATAARLHGTLIAFRWEEYGWATARLGPTADTSSNFGALYAGEWRQDHTLELKTYGGTAYGSWFLLAATRACSPIHDYSRGLYKKYDGGKPVWVRGSSVLHHTADELKQARDAAAARAAEAEDDLAEQELDTTGIALGDKLLAKGLAPHGEVVWYESVVLVKRSNRAPPLKARASFERMLRGARKGELCVPLFSQVMYLKAEDGESGLPTPQTAFVPTTHVKSR